MPVEFERLHVLLTPKAAAALTAVSEAEAMKKTDVVNRAVQLYAWIQERRNEGDELVIRHPDGTAELVQLF
jgi:hypothetical protein